MQTQTIVNSKQRGYSLIELSISLAIIGVVIAGSIIGVTSILRSNNVNKTISQTNTATNKIVARLARDTTYENATTELLSGPNQEIWDAAQIVGAGNVQHFFGNRVFVRPLEAAAFGVDEEQGYIYTLTGIPIAACSELAVGLETLALAMSITRQVAAPAPGPNALGDNLVKQPGQLYNSQTAIEACNTGDTQTTTISFLVPRR